MVHALSSELIEAGMVGCYPQKMSTLYCKPTVVVNGQWFILVQALAFAICLYLVGFWLLAVWPLADLYLVVVVIHQARVSDQNYGKRQAPVRFVHMPSLQPDV